ncbi:MAG TPA: hypothetical protein VN693_05670 [Rhodanobacteraceae bacterium]|nr:hypothetical protein [Rhodanobacteraceae bacterium]
MRRLLSKIFGLFASPHACSATCPTCGETCIAAIHGTGGHYCGNGHNWGSG